MLITSDDHSLQVDLQGGTVLSWQYRQYFVLGPARMELVNGQLKLRGFSHWCFPNFGTPAASTVWGSLPQHGFLRHLMMTLERASKERARLSFSSPPLSRTGPFFLTEVTTGANPFETRLLVRNDSEFALPIMPGFHPYFAVPASGIEVRAGGEVVPLTSGRDVVGPNIVRSSGPTEVVLNGVGTVTMEPSSNCKYVVVWSDQPDKYLCVEPVFHGRPDTFGTSDSYMLAPGEVSESNVFMDFRPFD